MFTKSLGEQGEWLVAEEYRRRGYKLISRNVAVQGYKQLGEIDVIVKKGSELVFVEVKTRTSAQFMDPVESVTWRKQNKLRKAVRAYIDSHREYDGFDFRIDAAIVEAALDPERSAKSGGNDKRSLRGAPRESALYGVDGLSYKVYLIEDVIQDIA